MLIPGKFHLGMTGAEWWEGFSEGDAGEEAGGGGESRAPSLFDRLVQTWETLHAVYLTTLSVCTYHIRNRPKMWGEESEEHAFPPLNITRAARADLCGTKVTVRRE